jgi:hypothetical protein
MEVLLSASDWICTSGRENAYYISCESDINLIASIDLIPNLKFSANVLDIG